MAAASSANAHCVGSACRPSVEVEAIDSTPMPYLPASCMPDGEIDDAVAIGMSSCTGRICSWASRSVNQSDSYVKRSSPRSRRMITPSASSWRSRWRIGSMPWVRASDGRAPGPEPNIARPLVMWSSWTIRWATLNGWWYGRLTTPVPRRIVWLTWPAAARNISGEAIISQPDEWCSPHQNSSKPRRSRWATRSRSRWNISVGCSPVGWCGARNAPKRSRSIAGPYGDPLGSGVSEQLDVAELQVPVRQWRRSVVAHRPPGEDGPAPRHLRPAAAEARSTETQGVSGIHS